MHHAVMILLHSKDSAAQNLPAPSHPTFQPDYKVLYDSYTVLRTR